MNAQPTAQQLHNVPVHDLAEAWHRLIVDAGHVDPAIELCAVPVLTIAHAVGWRPAMRVPVTRALIVLHCARPHASAEEALRCLVTLLGTMADTGAITLQEAAA